MRALVYDHPGTRTFHGRRRGACSIRAFTLIELLMVIAIISLLIAILLPALRNVRRLSWQTACQSNLRQVGTAWQNYFDDHGGRFPKGANVNINYGGKQGEGEPVWGSDPATPVPKPLNPYLRMEEVTRSGAEVFRCPADEGGIDVQPTHFDYFGTSYAPNTMIIGPPSLISPPTDPCKFVRAKVNKRLKNHAVSAQMSDPTRLILMGDFGWPYTLRFWTSTRIEWHPQPCSHNLAFMDGHVSYTRIRKGMLLTTDYTIIPFQDLLAETNECQEEVPCP